MQLKARDSPEGGDSGDGRTLLIFILCVSVVWTVSGEEGGGGNDRKDDESKYKHRRTRAPRAEAGVVIPSDAGKVGKSRRVCLHLHSWRLLTCDLPNGAEHVEFLRIQRFNIVIDVPASEKRTS